MRRDVATPLAFAALVAFGGFNAIAAKFTLVELAPFWSGALRLILAAAFFVSWMVLRRLELPRGRKLQGSLAYGFLGTAAFLGLMYWALQTTPAGFAMVILAIVPLLTTLFAAAHRLERLRPVGVLGSIVALGGIAVIASERLSAGSASLAGLVAIALAAAAMAETNVLVKLFPRPHPVVNNAIAMSIGAATLLFLAVLSGEALTLPQAPATWTALLYLVVPGTIVMFGLFLFIIDRWSATATSYALLLTPLVSVLGAAILLNEPITPVFIVGAALVLAGVYVGAFAPTISRPLAGTLPPTHAGRRRRTSRAGKPALPLGRQRQAEPDGRSLARCADGLDRAAVGLDQVARDGQAKATSRRGRVLGEALEHVG